jgi:DNA polymerase-3 subunit delta'
MLCESPGGDGMACGTCAGCRLATAGQHPDLLRLELLQFDAEEGGLVAGDAIAIDRIRALIEFAQLTSHRGAAKVAVIAPAERMNAAAANALLKTLEEPPRGTYLLLCTEQPGRLPPTIVSRCRGWHVPKPDPQTAAAWLRAQGAAPADLLLALASGGPLAALPLGDEGVQQERRAWLGSLARPQELRVTGLAARVEGGGREERKGRLAQVVEWLLAWVGDLARVRAGGRPALNIDFAQELTRLAPQVAPIALFRYHRSLLQQRLLLGHPLQPRLVAEALLIDYCALFANDSPWPKSPPPHP